MRSRTARLTASATACIALGIAGYLLYTFETRIVERREALREFDLHAREAATALTDMRTAQQAYVAAGQGVESWMPKVTTLQADMVRWVDDLRAAAASATGRTALMQAAASLNEFANVDRRVREYLRAGQTLMAGDVLFSESGDTAGAAARQVEAARLAEHLAFDAAEGDLRRRQGLVAGAAVAFSLLIMALLAWAPPERSSIGATSPSDAEAQLEEDSPRTGELRLRTASPSAAAAPTTPTPAPQPRGSVPLLTAAAELCTELGRVNDPGDLPALLARAADVLDASGIVVWVGSTAGADLRPVLAYGYPEQVLARMPNVPRSADNAAAAAYRSGKLQIVLRRPGRSNGAIVAPLLGPEGCVGALTAEILAGSETTDSVQAMAALLAAQLTGVVAGSSGTLSAPAETASRIASA